MQHPEPISHAQIALQILSPLLTSGQIPLPQQMTAGAAGWDVCAALQEPLLLAPGTWQAIPTGFAIGLPAYFECQVRSRSGLAKKHGVVCLNAPGTIDSDYRGEVQVLLINHSQEPFLITPGMRIAQLVFAPVAQVALAQVDVLPASQRGEQGFGSTGLVGKATGQVATLPSAAN